MAEFVLYPARLRADRFVRVRGGEPLTLGWDELAARIVPSSNRFGLKLLRQLRGGSFVGTRRCAQGVRAFILGAAGHSTSIAEVLRQDPLFSDDVVEVFWVDRVQWDSQVLEGVTP
jgi:hypothetical protein